MPKPHLIVAALLAGSALACGAPTRAGDGPAYGLAKSLPLGAPDRWDYVVVDRASGRVFVATATGWRWSTAGRARWSARSRA